MINGQQPQVLAVLARCGGMGSAAFDGSCELCKLEVKHYQGIQQSDVKFVDISALSPTELKVCSRAGSSSSQLQLQAAVSSPARHNDPARNRGSYRGAAAGGADPAQFLHVFWLAVFFNHGKLVLCDFFGSFFLCRIFRGPMLRPLPANTDVWGPAHIPGS